MFQKVAHRAPVLTACAQLETGSLALRVAVATFVHHSHPSEFEDTNAAYAALYTNTIPTTAAQALEPHDATLVPAAIVLLKAGDGLANREPIELISLLKNLYAPAFAEDRKASLTMIEELIQRHRGPLRKRTQERLGVLRPSGLSQSNYYYTQIVSSMCPSLPNRSCYPNNNVGI